MQVTTYQLMNEVKEAFLCEDYYIDEEWYFKYPNNYTNPNVNYVVSKRDNQLSSNIQWWFNKRRHGVSENEANVSANLELKRLITLHNFMNGYIWFRYSVKYYDEKGNHLAGAVRILVKMKIHKKDGEWKVVQIWEKP